MYLFVITSVNFCTPSDQVISQIYFLPSGVAVSVRAVCVLTGTMSVPDENSFSGTQAALDLVQNLEKEDTVLFLLSGGGSALFEKPLVTGAELQDVTASAQK